MQKRGPVKFVLDFCVANKKKSSVYHTKLFFKQKIPNNNGTIGHKFRTSAEDDAKVNGYGFSVR